MVMMKPSILRLTPGGPTPTFACRWSMASLPRRTLGALALILPAAFLGCSRATQNTQATASPHSIIIDADRIAQSGAATAWDALRLTVPVLQFRENSRGTPVRITRRGRSSIVLADQPLIWVDNVRVWDIRNLDLMPAADIHTIEVLTGLEGTTQYGASNSTGVILIRTKAGT